MSRSRLIWLSPILIAVGLASLYWGVLASERYLSTATVVVEKSDGDDSTQLSFGSMLGGPSVGGQDLMLVKEFVASQDLFERLDERFDLRAHYSAAEVDFWSRLPADAPKEAFVEKFRSYVTATYDDETSVLLIEVQSYDPERAKRMLDFVLEESEAFVNGIGHSIARQQMEFVTGELARSEERLRGAKRELLRFQNEHDMMSPRQQAEARAAIISEMQGELASKKAQLKTKRSYLNPGASEVVALRNEIAALEEQISQENAELVGPGSFKLNDLLARFQSLETEVTFAQKRYEAVLASLESARADALRKLKHLVVVASPSVPGEAEYPARGYNIATVAFFALLLTGIARLVAATIQDHRD